MQKPIALHLHIVEILVYLRAEEGHRGIVAAAWFADLHPSVAVGECFFRLFTVVECQRLLVDPSQRGTVDRGNQRVAYGVLGGVELRFEFRIMCVVGHLSI